MERRKALVLLGTMVMVFAGKPVRSEKESSATAERIDWDIEPATIVIHEESFRDIIIRRKNGREIKIPFSEIVDALV